MIRKNISPWDDRINKGLNIADFVRFYPYTYARTQQSLPPLMGGNNLTLTILFVPSEQDFSV